ncbi:molybdopterin-containing oxidoreductase family protein [Desulfatitalea alkaliphila]|uniref:Molybdopterin-dependent oxidoreductase n=1 Tax=Desulfatitalea alkaliphila TaxID=2929485 RepID=A0AA41UL64_9BACT|nr:molybdopterin-dependent oxidoreductase [Desulfatitalea alkaliphila]MCJ8502152.1 molybdopterin-dependent oxidoreductase [Desulfatitalea alkaliphila]
MKLSRRCFLSFVIGGAAGTALSPLPWKLTDDIAIWSQNWPWTPVPPDGAYSYTPSTCTLCPGHCAIQVRKVDNRAVKIEGRGEKGPAGGICPLGLSGLQLLYGPTRIQAPLQRVGDRGAGHWRTLTWAQAIDAVVTKLAEIRAKGTPQALAAIAPTDQGTVAQLLQRLLTAYGSPNFLRMPSADDSAEAALRLTTGTDAYTVADLDKTDFILSFGCALMDGYGAPVQTIRAVTRMRERKGTLVQIEPRLSNTAAKADTWLAAQPGSEADLALAMAHVIIGQGRFDARFAMDRIDGFDGFARMVRDKYAPRNVAQTTGIDAETITRTALAFADARRPVALHGRGKGEMPGSLKEALAVQILNALVGNIDQPGGMQIHPAANGYIQWPAVASDAVASAGMGAGRLDEAGGSRFPHVRHLMHRFIERIDQDPDAVQALLVAEANPCHNLPDSDKVKAALGKIPFVVSFSSFMDETAMQSDLILPSHLYLERYEDVPVTRGGAKPTIRLCRPVVAPLYKTQHPGDTILRIAKALPAPVAAAFPWRDYETCLRDTLAHRWSAMDSKGFWIEKPVAAAPVAAAAAVETTNHNGPEEGVPAAADAPAAPAAATAQARRLALLNDDLSAVLMADNATLSDEAGHPLTLVPFDSIRTASGYAGDPPFMVKIVEDTVLKEQDGCVEINPTTAAQAGLREGQGALLSTPVGQARVRIHLSEGIMPGLLALPRGMGHTAYDAYLSGKGVNINQLIGSVQDPASGLDAVWGIRAKLTKA